LAQAAARLIASLWPVPAAGPTGTALPKVLAAGWFSAKAGDLKSPGPVASLALRRHLRQQRFVEIDIVVDDHLARVDVLPLEASGVLGQGSPPGNRKREEEGVEPRVVAAFAQVAA